jgi:hypothetical protein
MTKQDPKLVEAARSIARGEKFQREMEEGIASGRLVMVGNELVDIMDDEPSPAPPPEDTRTEYTSDSRPLDVRSRDRFHRVCRAMARDGISGVSKIGRRWKVTRAAWEAYRVKAGPADSADPDEVRRTLAKLR